MRVWSRSFAAPLPLTSPPHCTGVCGGGTPLTATDSVAALKTTLTSFLAAGVCKAKRTMISDSPSLLVCSYLRRSEGGGSRVMWPGGCERCGVLHKFGQCPRQRTCTSCRRHRPPPRPRSWQPGQHGSSAPPAAQGYRPCHPCSPSSRRCRPCRPRRPRRSCQARPSASPSWQDQRHPWCAAECRGVRCSASARSPFGREGEFSGQLPARGREAFVIHSISLSSTTSNPRSNPRCSCASGAVAPPPTSPASSRLSSACSRAASA